MSATSTLTAHNGFALPPQGLGTYRLSGEAGAAAVRSGVEAGYRLVDSATNYENEGAVGHGVAGAAVGREAVIVTTKLAGRHHASELARPALEESRFRLGVDVIDLVLIHWPNPITDRYVEAWEALIQARAAGIVRQIGVSNFLPEHLERLERSTGVLPVVNQIELHPYFPQEEALQLHRERGIITQGWSPLGRGGELLDEAVLRDIAAVHRISPAQVVLAWHAARGVVALPKAASAAHQRSNLDALEIALTDAEVEAINALGRSDGRLFNGDPALHEEF